MPVSLADDLTASLELVPGSPERDHILALLRRAKRIRLEDEVTRAAAATVRHASDTIERSLDRLLLHHPVTWIEYATAPRIAAFGDEAVPLSADTPTSRPERVGCLIACNPDSPSQIAVFVSWRFTTGAVHHAYALLHWDRASFLALAAAAPEHDDGEAAERLMTAAATVIPPGLLAELEIWQDIAVANDPRRDMAILQTQRDASGEHLFLLASLLLIESSAVDLEAAPEASDVDRDEPRTWSARLIRGKTPWWAKPWRRAGFSIGLRDVLRWSEPAPKKS